MTSNLEPCGEEWLAYCQKDSLCYRNSKTKEKVCKCPDGVVAVYCEAWRPGEKGKPKKAAVGNEIKPELCADEIAEYQQILTIVGVGAAVAIVALLVAFFIYLRKRRSEKKMACKVEMVHRDRSPMPPGRFETQDRIQYQRLIQLERAENDLSNQEMGNGPELHESMSQKRKRLQKSLSLPAGDEDDEEKVQTALTFDPNCQQCLSSPTTARRVVYTGPVVVLQSGNITPLIAASQESLTENRAKTPKRLHRVGAEERISESETDPSPTHSSSLVATQITL